MSVRIALRPGHGCISIFLRSLARVAIPTAPIVLYNIFPVGTRAWYQCACRAKISSHTLLTPPHPAHSASRELTLGVFIEDKHHFIFAG